jgi:hypothetical protein
MTVLTGNAQCTMHNAHKKTGRAPPPKNSQS